MPTYMRVLGDDIEVDEERDKPTPFHSPSEALQTHCDLLDWVDSEYGFAFTRDIVLRHKHNDGIDEHGNPVAPDDDGIVEGYRSILWDSVNHNSTMFVSAHMCDQLQALIPTFEDEPLWLTDLPDARGTVLFEAAIRSVMSDHPSQQHPGEDPIDYWIKGFAYRMVEGDIASVERNGVAMNIHIASPPQQGPEVDERVVAFQANGGLMVWPLFDAGEMFVAHGQWEEHGGPPMLPMPFVAIPFGPKVEGPPEEGMLTDLTQMRQLVVTLFRLIWQHIILEDDHFPRPEQRRMDRIARKHKRLLDDGEAIKVRHLRRLEVLTEPSPRDDERSPQALTYRIIVRGHPRDQHYPSLGPARIDGEWNPDSHRKIWISPHIRGPEDSPLVLKHALDAVVR